MNSGNEKSGDKQHCKANRQGISDAVLHSLF
jgi:hypothetical protein